MKKRYSMETEATNAWAKSVNLAVGVPPVLLVILSYLTTDYSGGLLVVFFSVPIHLFFYWLLGIPIFLYFWNKPYSLIWNGLISILIGRFLGVSIPLAFILLAVSIS